MAPVVDQGKNGAIIYVFPATHLSLCDFNQNIVNLLPAYMFPVDMHNMRI